MRRIQVLSDSVKNKIAAGEVVEGPFSVVKELVENAIDAGAGEITVEVAESGFRKILVRDNGSGILREDLPLSVREHATSKIRSIEDIERIASCGFRGEALSSIAAISRLTLLSRSPEEETGGRLVCDNGRVDIGEYAGPHGTTVIVENIFFNVPARKKFMKSRTGEQRAVRQAFLATALARPEISFTLVSDEEKKISLPATGDIAERVAQIYGRAAAEGLYRESISDMKAGLEGFLSSPGFFKASRAMQALYVNRRPVEYRSLGFLLSKAYEGVVPRGQHPAAILFLAIDPSLVDVNIHPAKREVKFFDGRYIDGLILGLAKKALGGRAHPIDTGLFREAVLQRREGPLTSGDASAGGDISAPAAEQAGTEPASMEFREHPRQPVQASLQFENGNEKTFIREVREVYEHAFRAPEEESAAAHEDREARYLGVIFDTYLLVDHGGELGVIDFHAAHERILFDELTAKEWSPDTQELMFPAVKEFSIDACRLIEEKMDLFAGLGFDIEPISECAFAVRGVPAVAAKFDMELFFDEIVDRLQEETQARDLRKVVIERIACHAAWRAGDAVPEPQARRLIDEVFSGRHELRCPHGRPFVFSLKKRDFERLFGRS